MSAAEKLKALEANLSRWTNGYESVSIALVEALPQIRALVEEAAIVEECYDALEEDGYKYLGDGVREALAALDEKLGDVT